MQITIQDSEPKPTLTVNSDSDDHTPAVMVAFTAINAVSHLVQKGQNEATETRIDELGTGQ